ncbi:hypothetical protein SteCoe_5566 [Stentor coeruleus]|uniref:Uncharacterized protein n=1 Tax=Stentor coeruleus TaxID=5963 RepID=A0A1R2CS24_9CILI|nr:hypothetical protein SteCoe_5566 [Stentor coeruleus]
MTSFQERFKGKSSTTGRYGELSIIQDRAINRPTDYQVHSPIIKSSAKSIIDSSKDNTKIISLSKIPSSASPNHNFSLVKRQSSQPPNFSISTSTEDSYSTKSISYDYKPYTIHDYYSIKTNKYYELGGLGSPTIGTEDWVKRKNISDKRKEYGKKAMISPRDSITDNAIGYLERINKISPLHKRHSSALN